MNTRRQFLLTAPLGVLAATSACGTPGPSSSGPTPMNSSAASPSTPGAPPTFGTAPSRATGVSGDVCRSGKAGAGDDATHGPRSRGVELAAIARAAPRAASRTAPGRDRRGGRARHDLDALAHRRPSRADARRVRAQPRQHEAAAGKRRGHRIRAGDRSLALDGAEAITSDRLTHYLQRMTRSILRGR